MYHSWLLVKGPAFIVFQTFGMHQQLTAFETTVKKVKWQQFLISPYQKHSMDRFFTVEIENNLNFLYNRS